METTFFKCAFIVLMGIALLGATTMVIGVIALGLRIVGERLKATGETHKAGQT